MPGPVRVLQDYTAKVSGVGVMGLHFNKGLGFRV